MPRTGRFAFTFAGPLLLLSAAAVTAWLALGDAQTSFGPMRLAPLPPRTSVAPDAALNEPPPTTLEPISPAQAELRNALLPYSSAPLLSGSGFAAGREDAAAASQCMTQAIYYEAGNEPDAGKRAVAQVILNRVASPAFPKTVCTVVQQGANHPGCQFTFMCDGSLSRTPNLAGWTRAREIAEDALKGYIDAAVGGATHYHADYVFPTWAPSMIKLAKIGRHIFYRWPGAQVTPMTPVDVSPPPAAQVTQSAVDVSLAPAPPPAGLSTLPPIAFAPTASPPIDAASPRPTSAPTTSEGAPQPAPQPPKAPPVQLAPHRALPEERMRD